VYFGAAAAAALGYSVHCLTRAAARAPALPAWMAELVSWLILPSQYTTTFENAYDVNHHRTQRVWDPAEPIGRSDVPSGWRTADVVHLAPVIGELRPDVLDDIVSPFVGLAAQGWLRDVGAGGAVGPGPWRVPAALETRSHAIAVSEEDLGPGRDAIASIAWRRPGTLLAVTRGPAGADLYADEAEIHLPAPAVRAVDATGAGDVFAATLFARLAEGASPKDAGAWAASQAAGLVAAGNIAGLLTREQLARLV
jgi:hypothetical protein